MHSVTRQIILNRTLSSRSFVFHNGKGRPEPALQKLFSRPISTESRNLLPSKRPSCLRTKYIFPAAPRYISSSSIATKDTILQPASSEHIPKTGGQADLNAWDANFGNTVSFDSLPSIEPHIGFLKELGLDFGWGPTSCVQWLVEHVHVYSDLPWYGTFLVSALVIRILLFPIFARASSMSARLASVDHILRPLRERSMQARRDGDHAAMTAAIKELRMVQRHMGINSWAVFYPMLTQVPLGFGAYRLSRNMAELPVPGLENGGALWFMDLTVADPTFAISILTSGIMYLGMRKGGELGVQTAAQQKLMDIMKFCFPLISFAITCWMPVTVTLQFAVASFLSLCQTYLFTNKHVRRSLGMYPLSDKKAKAASEPYKGNITRHVVNTTANAQPEPSMLKKAVTRAKEYTGQDSSGKRLDRRQQAKADAYEKRRREELEEQAFHRRRELKNRRDSDGNGP